MARQSNFFSDELQLVTVKHHEGAVIFSYEGETALPFELLRERIESLIDRVQREVERQDGVVGHVKAFTEDSGASAMFSATGDLIHFKPGKERTTKLIFTAIVFISEEAPVLDMMEEALSQF